MEFFPEPHIILQIGALKIYFYGAMYALGAVCGFWITKMICNAKNFHITSETLLDLVFWTMLGGVLGGRIFYAMVYNFSFFIEHPFSIFAVWNGGMSIHGGLLGGAIAFVTFCRKQKISLWKMADSITPALALGLALGRLGNFVNKELVGRASDVFWAIDFGDGILRHPSQLYAMGKDILLMTICFFLIFHTHWFEKKSGQIFAFFLGTYAVFRFSVEFFREPDQHIGFLALHFSMGQWLSVLAFFVSIGIFLILKKREFQKIKSS